MRSKREEVELVGVPHYIQGEADGLCVYYAVSMMLAALHPEWRLSMHELPSYSWRGSPVFQGLRRLYPSERRFKEKLATWFFHGMTISEATLVLNRFFRLLHGSKAIYFEHQKVRARRARRLKYARRRRALDAVWSVNDVLTSISWHLPVVIAGGGLGAHAVVAIGYEVRGNSDRFIGYHDPALIRPEWRPCGEVFIGDAEIIVPCASEFRKYRPARVKRYGGESTFELWDPKFLEDPL